MKFSKLAILSISAIIIFNSCATYHWGSLGHPQIKSIAVAKTKNETTNPTAGITLRNQLSAKLMQETSAKLKTTNKADVILQTTITDIRTRAIASSKVRAREVRDHKRDAYQTALYQVTITVRYTLIIAKTKEIILEPTTITSTSEFSKMPDLSQARIPAIQKALATAAEEITDAITEAW